MPPNSLDFNPVEVAFFKLKTLLTKGGRSNDR